MHMRVLGIDCGGEDTGSGVVEMDEVGKLCCLICGAIKLSPREALPRRLSRIFIQLGEIIAAHQPDEVAIEDVFYALNVKSALKLGQVRGWRELRNQESRAGCRSRMSSILRSLWSTSVPVLQAGAGLDPVPCDFGGSVGVGANGLNRFVGRRLDRKSTRLNSSH